MGRELNVLLPLVCCENIVCEECLEKIISTSNSSCPMCRKRFTRSFLSKCKENSSSKLLEERREEEEKEEEERSNLVKRKISPSGSLFEDYVEFEKKREKENEEKTKENEEKFREWMRGNLGEEDERMRKKQKVKEKKTATIHDFIGRAADGKWICHVCTLINQPSYLTCKACISPRSNSSSSSTSSSESIISLFDETKKIESSRGPIDLTSSSSSSSQAEIIK